MSCKAASEIGLPGACGGASALLIGNPSDFLDMLVHMRRPPGRRAGERPRQVRGEG